jgi:hypothetical protein
MNSPLFRRMGALMLAAAASMGAAPGQKDYAAAPVPPQINAAKKAFISNAGGGCAPFGNAGFSGGRDRPYSQFYAAVRDWGRYELALSPAEADLALEISFSCPAAGATVTRGNSLPPSYDPELRLRVLDVKTHIVLWGFNEHVMPANRQANRDKNFDAALNKLVDDLISLVATPLPSAARPGK